MSGDLAWGEIGDPFGDESFAHRSGNPEQRSWHVWLPVALAAVLAAVGVLVSSSGAPIGFALSLTGYAASAAADVKARRSQQETSDLRLSKVTKGLRLGCFILAAVSAFLVSQAMVETA